MDGRTSILTEWAPSGGIPSFRRLLLHTISGCCEAFDEGIIPLLVGKIVQCGFYPAPEPFEFSAIRQKRPLIQHPPGPPALCITDDKAPAAVIAADFRAGQMDSAPCLPGVLIKPQKRACLGEVCKTAFVFVEDDLVRVNADFLYIARIVVVDDKSVIAAVFSDGMDELHVAAAVAALGAFTGDGDIPPGQSEVRTVSWSLIDRCASSMIRCMICFYALVSSSVLARFPDR